MQVHDTEEFFSLARSLLRAWQLDRLGSASHEYPRMKRNILGFCTALVAGTVGISTLAIAAPTPVYGTNQTPAFTVSGDPLTQRTNFEKMLLKDSIQREGFSSIASGEVQTLALSSLGATLVNDYNYNPPVDRADGLVASGGQREGRFNTTDATSGPTNGKWWETRYSFSLTFATAVSAFGFYGTDFGDFDGTFELELVRAGGGNPVKVPFVKPQVGTGPSPTDSSDDTANGWLQFFAFWDPVDSYTEVRFNITQVGTNPNNWDVLGFDDFVVGTLDRSQMGVPEPGSLALVGASLLALGAVRRRRQA